MPLLTEIVITNNPMVRDRIQGAPESKLGAACNMVEFHETDYLGVLKVVRDRIHLGYGLLTHPLSGSVKPGETPYKTVVISAERGSLDEKALLIIEDSIQTCLKLTKNGLKKDWSGKILADFQLIDYSLVFGSFR